MVLKMHVDTAERLARAVVADESPMELSIQDALEVAIHLQRAGHLDDAETLYRRVSEASPANADAIHYLGVLLHQRGKADEAMALIAQSIAMDPEQPDRYNNLGNVLVEQGKLEEALTAFEKVIALRPGHADAYNNLGAVLRAQHRSDEAFAAYNKAIELNPKHVDAYRNLGNLVASHGRVKEATVYYCKAVTLSRRNPEARQLLGIAYGTLGQVEEAAQVFREWLREEPDDPVAKHLLAACSGQDVPARAGDAYIEANFDAFADSFDHKLARLSYRAPQLIADALAHVDPNPAKRFIALDAGCGTGLCGPLLAPYVSRITGVDLSSRMLAEAEKRHAYDQLVKAELTAYLAAHSDAYDLIVSADTLVYFGALEDVLSAAAVTLHDSGLLLFTVEEALDLGSRIGYRINPHGRYSHSQSYVRNVLAARGMNVLSIDRAMLRTEGGSPVHGLVVTARKGPVPAQTRASADGVVEEPHHG
jgi:predicted TPR repeat methyltransferase